VLRRNRFFDNYRRGVMLFAVPDATVCGPVIGSTTPVPGCDPMTTSTSFDNSFYENLMGIAPSGAAAPNGVDFWWDSFPGNTGNCWWGNEGVGPLGVTSSPPVLPDCLGGSTPALSVGTGYLPNEAELVGCLAGFETGGYPNGDQRLCDWTITPAKPGAKARASASAAGGSLIARERQRHFVSLCSALPDSRTCAPFVPDAGALARGKRSPKAKLTGKWARRPLGLYTCADWRKASPRLKRGLLARLAHFTGGEVHGDRLAGYGTVLRDRSARRLFAGQCRGRSHRSFALYKLYGQAAGFAGVRP
jgi:hypothetical protein